MSLALELSGNTMASYLNVGASIRTLDKVLLMCGRMIGSVPQIDHPLSLMEEEEPPAAIGMKLACAMR